MIVLERINLSFKFSILKQFSMTKIKNNYITRYLGIDYGKSKIGLALADSETRIAFAYKTLDNNKDFFQKLGKIIDQENVTEIIIGIPAYVSQSEIKSEARKLGEKIKEIFKIGVEYQNEMFTTKMARGNLKEKGLKKIKRYDDQEAAKIILQDWLDRK